MTAPDDIDGVRVRASTRARRFSLRVDARTGDVVLVFPPRGSVARARDFIAAHRDWIETRRADAQSRPRPADGMTISLLGVPHVVMHRAGRGVTRVENGHIIVHGTPAHIARRLRDALKIYAEDILIRAAKEKAAHLGLKPAEIRVRDPKSRWGSCGPDGRIMLSWRLILAPPAVLDYVVAHETAHRRHMNHGRQFWALCASLCDNAGTSRRWLKHHGGTLMSMF